MKLRELTTGARFHFASPENSLEGVCLLIQINPRGLWEVLQEGKDGGAFIHPDTEVIPMKNQETAYDYFCMTSRTPEHEKGKAIARGWYSSRDRMKTSCQAMATAARMIGEIKRPTVRAYYSGTNIIAFSCEC